MHSLLPELKGIVPPLLLQFVCGPRAIKYDFSTSVKSYWWRSHNNVHLDWKDYGRKIALSEASMPLVLSPQAITSGGRFFWQYFFEVHHFTSVPSLHPSVYHGSYRSPRGLAEGGRIWASWWTKSLLTRRTIILRNSYHSSSLYSSSFSQSYQEGTRGPATKSWSYSGRRQ